MNKEQFLNELTNLGISYDSEKLSKLEQYYNLLIEENQKYNLTAITEKNTVYLKHFYDSLTIKKAINLDNQYICDIGTGAGFPGIVLKIFYPDIKIDLIDSTTKKCNFLNLVINTLSLTNIKVINARIEEYAKENREKYDIVVSRAVAPLKHLLEYDTPMIKIKGQFIALKSNIDQETLNISRYYQKLSLSNPQTYSFTLPYELSHRTIYKIEKHSKTNPLYPRPYSKIKKQEL